MKILPIAGGALILAATLGACSSTGSRGALSQGGMEVARSHLGQPVARTQIAIEAFDAADRNRPEFASFVAAVGRQLTRLGWTVVPAGGTEQVAMIDVEQGSREAITALSAARIGRGIAPGAAEGSSAGVVATLLEVAIRRRSDGSVFWEGRAVGEARTGSAGASRMTAVDKLAEALFRDFPGESGRTIRVR